MRRIRPDSARLPHAGGFTLIEMIAVMTITGILVAVVAVFISRPMQGIIDTTRRAGLADAADTALRRMNRDIHRALPNSVRVTQSGSSWYIEFLPVLAAGRYCEAADCGTAPLDFATPSSSFSYVGPQATLASGSVSTSEVAIYNLGVSGANAYAGDNTAALSAIGSNTITLAASKTFPYPSPGHRFFIIGMPVSYVCTPGGKLLRVTGYTKQSAQPTTTLSGGSVLANNVSGCNMDYQQSAIDQFGLLYMTLTLTSNNESVTLTHGVQISNMP
jgi:MSHA biogenesis protein MshO